MFGKKKLKIEVYEGQKALEKGRTKMLKKGWTVDDVLSDEAGRSKKSWVMIGPLNFARKKNVRYTVTFVRG